MREQGLLKNMHSKNNLIAQQPYANNLYKSLRLQATPTHLCQKSSLPSIEGVPSSSSFHHLKKHYSDSDVKVELRVLLLS